MTRSDQYLVKQLYFVDDESGPAPLSSTSRSEQMGSKEKMWVQDAHSGEEWLLKFARAGTGENWSEKIAAEVAALLDIPHPMVELGVLDGRPVSLTKNFLVSHQELVHGNELLFRTDPNYPFEKQTRSAEHTVTAVRDVLDLFRVEVSATWRDRGLSAFGLFVGYLLLDALLGNTDRHHENWGIIVTAEGRVRRSELAPSYDHASSLGRELKDERRAEMMTTADQRGNVQAYCSRAFSALYRAGETNKPLSCTGAFQHACELDQFAADYWLKTAGAVDPAALQDIVERTPNSTMSDQAKEFATAMMKNRLQSLLDLKR